MNDLASAQRCKHCGYTREEHDDPSEFVPQELPTSNQRLECITLPNNSVVIDGTAYDHLAQVAQENVNLRAQLSCATAELAWAEECGRKRDAGETTEFKLPYRTALEFIRDSVIPQDMSPALFAERVLRLGDAASPEKANAHNSWCLCSDCLDKRGRQEAAEKTESPLAQFVHSSPAEREAIGREIIEAASAAQQAVLERAADVDDEHDAPDFTLPCANCGRSLEEHIGVVCPVPRT